VRPGHCAREPLKRGMKGTGGTAANEMLLLSYSTALIMALYNVVWIFDPTLSPGSGGGWRRDGPLS